jgi:hypothetical protein
LRKFASKLIRVLGGKLVVILTKDIVVDLRDFLTCIQAVLKLLQLLTELRISKRHASEFPGIERT